MRTCPYCSYSNYPTAIVCRKCDSPLGSEGGTVYSGPRRAISQRNRPKLLRSRALAMIVLGLLMKVYWGGYGPWPVIDFPVLVGVRLWLEPTLLFGGAALYLYGWVAPYL